MKYRFDDGTFRASAAAFLNAARDLNVKRNEIVHGRWVEILGEREEILHFALTGNARNRVKPKARAQTVTDLLKLGDTIREQVIEGCAILRAAPAAILPLSG